MVDAECSVLCKKETPALSLFRKMNVDHLHQFSWSALIDDLQTKAPVLFKMFNKIVSHSDKRNQVKHGAVHHPGICVAVATILKERNREMVGLQTVLSLLLFKACVKKQVHYISVMS